MIKAKTFREAVFFPRSVILSVEGEYSIDDLILEYAKYYHKETLKKEMTKTKP